MEFKKVDACKHDPKIVIKTFSLPDEIQDGKDHVALCKSCSDLGIFNKFVVETFELNAHNIKFLKLTNTYTIKEYTYSEN